MSHPSPTEDRGFQPRNACRRGIALVVVLSMLVLVAALVVGFFSSVTTDLSTTQGYANAASSRQLSESAVNIVMAQIVQGASSSGTLTWTSQPGLIRTFDNNGGKANFYKLYSSDSMIVDGSGFSADAEVPPSNWNTESAIFTDLNSPVLISDSTGTIKGSDGNTYASRFPIIDGNYLVDGSTLTPRVPTTKPNPSATYLTYDAPVRDNTGNIVQNPDGVADIDGFYVQSPSTYNNHVAISGSNNPVPMPVKWLYVLQNGKIVAPVSGSGGQVADFSSASADMQPSATNPIVGRVAFWTDDESCKVNINTAAGDVKVQYPIDPSAGIAFGSFWDIPRADNADERGANTGNGQFLPGLAWSQPVVNEFQRYPGHPATVALNTVFPTFTRDDIGGIVPRIQNGGSLGGSWQAQSPGTPPIPTDADRLYASVDELMFKPALNSGNRQQNQATKITREKLEQSRFFLTASSRAPDVNLFGQPRVCIWPISSQIGTSGTAYGTAYDRLISFCTTIGSNQYYFQRANSASSTSDYQGIPRNKALYSYLENMTAPTQGFPGFANTAGGFLTKYGNDRDQILTEIFDYIRCVNLADLSVTHPFTPSLNQTSANANSSASGLVAPIQITSPNGVITKGFGRFPTLMEAALQFYVDTVTSSTSTTTTGTSYSAATMKAIFIPKLFNPMLGYYPVMDSIDQTATFSTGTNDWSVTLVGGTNVGTNLPLNFPTQPQTNSILQGGIVWGSRPWGGEQFFAEQFLLNSAYQPSPARWKTLGWSGTQGGIDVYPFCSDPTKPGVNISGTGISGFNFSGGTITYTIAYHNQPPVQKITLTFPSATNWPLPTVSSSNQGQYASTWNGAYNQRMTSLFTGNGTPAVHPNVSDLIDSNDMVKALEAVGPSFWAYPNIQGASMNPQAPFGDIRLVALTPTDTTSFHPHYDYFNDTTMHSVPLNAHSLRTGGSGSPPLYPGCSNGQLVGPYTGNPNNQTTFGYCAPAITGGILDITAHGKFAGDWDNGIAYWPDGPYANKPDEGDIYGALNNAMQSIYQPYYQSSPNAFQYATAFVPLYFSPNRQMASAVMFGSLPSGALGHTQNGVSARWPWQTLLFHSDPSGTHPGLNAPRDHLLLDLFTMPVVEPYAISEPFSTAGRINLNCQIMPFGTSIVRETSLLSVFESTWIMAIPATDILNGSYKGTTNGSRRNYRYPIDGAATLTEFESRFNNSADPNYNRNFVTASELCDIDLYPVTNLTTGPTGVATGTAALTTYWGTGSPALTTGNTLTGDSTREMPYNHLYPLVTTKSNTFTVHMRVQTLKQVRAGRGTPADWAKWTEGKDQVIGEYRGSTIIERYVDPNDSRFTSGQIDPDSQSLDSAYRFRVINVKKFTQE